MGKALAAWLLLAVASAASGPAPRDTVQGAVTRVIAALDAVETDRPDADPGRALAKARAQIRRIATELFDFEEIARRALSRHWAGRTAAEQSEFTALFTTLLERAYVDKIEGYAGEQIVYLSESVDGEYATVRSRIVTRRRSEMAIDYRLHLREGRWKVYDVLVDGVSFVSTWRSEFNRVIQSSSYGELVERLRKRQIDIHTVGTRGQG